MLNSKKYKDTRKVAQKTFLLAFPEKPITIWSALSAWQALEEISKEELKYIQNRIEHYKNILENPDEQE